MILKRLLALSLVTLALPSCSSGAPPQAPLRFWTPPAEKEFQDVVKPRVLSCVASEVDPEVGGRVVGRIVAVPGPRKPVADIEFELEEGELSPDVQACIRKAIFDFPHLDSLTLIRPRRPLVGLRIVNGERDAWARLQRANAGACAQKDAESNPCANATATIHVLVAAEGRVTSVEVDSSKGTLSSSLQRCIIDTITASHPPAHPATQDREDINITFVPSAARCRRH